MIDKGQSKKNDNRAAALVKHFQTGVGIAFLENTVQTLRSQVHRLKSEGFRQTDLAARIGIGQGTLSKWLSGDHNLTFGQFICALKGLDLTLEDITFPGNSELALSGLHHAMCHHPATGRQLCKLGRKHVLWILQVFHKADLELKEKAMAVSFKRFLQDPKQPGFYQANTKLMSYLRNRLNSLVAIENMDPAVCFGDWAGVLFDCDRILQRCEIYLSLKNHPQISDQASS